MPIIDIIPGVKVYQTEQFSILFGCPPEIIKHLIVKKIPFPDYIVIPDTIHKDGVLQNATEFPFYYFLFVQGNFFKGKKLSILGEHSQVQNNQKLLSLTLLGPTKKEYNAIGDSPYFDGLYNESRLLSIKDKNNKEIPVDGFVQFTSFKDNLLNTEHFKLKHCDKNIYEIDGNIIDINFTEKQLPPYDLKPDFIPMMPEMFGINVLGGASGFTADNPCSGLILNYHSDFMLIDCVPYLEYSLNARGISKQQIKSLFLTHIHDDHCNIFPLVLFNNKTNFLATKEIYWMACRKLALMTMSKTEDFYSYFNFIELEPYKTLEFYGITITPHYTVHSIPTIGATFRMKFEGHDRSLVFVGDNKALPEIKNMADKGQVSQSKYKNLLKLYRDKFDITFADGGMGVLHGDPKDSLKSKSNRVVFMHLEKLPVEFDTTFTLAIHGKKFTIEEADDGVYLIKTMLILNHHYKGISDEWFNTILSNLRLAKFNTGDVIMKQGEPRNGMIYIILSGKVSVLYHDGKKLKLLSIKETGDVIGDMAVVNRVKKRSASIVAQIPVTLCEINEDIFYSFLKSENRIDHIKETWDIRSKLEVYHPFTKLSDLVNFNIAAAAKLLVVKENQHIIEQGTTGREFFIILSGSFSIIRDNKEINILGPGNMFGEYGYLADKTRNATVKAKEKGEIIQIDKDDINKIINSTPALNFYTHQVMTERN